MPYCMVTFKREWQAGDLHAVACWPEYVSQQTLCTSYDGNLAITTKLNTTHLSKHSRQLPNFWIRKFIVGYMDPEIVAASLQDDGNI